MFGSGAKTIARRGLIMIIVLSLENVCGAVPGAAIHVTAVPLSVSTTTAAPTATTISVFGWCATISQ